MVILNEALWQTGFAQPSFDACPAWSEATASWRQRSLCSPPVLYATVSMCIFSRASRRRKRSRITVQHRVLECSNASGVTLGDLSNTVRRSLRDRQRRLGRRVELFSLRIRFAGGTSAYWDSGMDLRDYNAFEESIQWVPPPPPPPY